MTILDPNIEEKIQDLGDAGVAKLRELLDDKANEATVGWQKSIYTLMSSSVGIYGPTGVTKALNALDSLVNGDDPDFDWSDVDLEVSSDILARMQNMEAGNNTANRAFLIKVGEAVKEIIGVVLAVL